MSVHGASQMRCAACATQVSLENARSQWWICTVCGSYVCPSCRALFLESGQDTCPGAIVRGSEAHSPHFTRFLGPRLESESQPAETRRPVRILGDVSRHSPQPPGGKVVILSDEEGIESSSEADQVGRDNDE
ncbi:MAG: hypothetical protein ACFE9D_04485 [Promethearchaeota archaeon]